MPFCENPAAPDKFSEKELKVTNYESSITFNSSISNMRKDETLSAQNLNPKKDGSEEGVQKALSETKPSSGLLPEQKESEEFLKETSIVTANQLRKLLESMDLECKDKKRILEGILGKNKSTETILKICKRSEKPSNDAKRTRRNSNCSGPTGDLLHPNHCKNIEESNSQSAVSEDNFHFNEFKQRVAENCLTSGDHDRTHARLNGSPRGCNEMKSIFSCKNKPVDDKFPPCMCQNCTVVGAIQDSPKKPIFTCEQRRSICDKKKRDKTKKHLADSKSEEHLYCQMYYSHLNDKIKMLEHRLIAHEDKLVTKDYFKKIITKLVVHMTKMSNSTSDANNKDPDSNKSKTPPSTALQYPDQIVCPIMMKEQIPEKLVQSEAKSVETSTTTVKPRQLSVETKTEDHCWRWGSEILYPGMDLKNKVIMLLESKNPSQKETEVLKPEMLNQIPSKEDICKNRKFRSWTNENIEKNIPEKLLKKETEEIAEQVDKLVKNYIDQVKPPENDALPPIPRSLLSPIHQEIVDTRVNVAYMNPKMSVWQEDSQVSIKADVPSVHSCHPEIISEDFCKEEFQKMLMKTKDEDKLKLWNSVWEQAKLNGQTKRDRVTIQIPNANKDKTIEIHYTIAALEALLKKKKAN